MARSAEKAMTALARWRSVYIDKVDKAKRRPHIANECDNLKEALQYRRQIVNEISRKVAQIQNPILGEYKLRDLNDEINKLIREKGHWEARIKELDGPDYQSHGPKMLDREGREVPGNRGYRYFGAARDLPGVRELFEAEPAPPPRKNRGELMKSINVDYYGYRDEDDGVIVPQEQELEKEVMARKLAEWTAQKEAIARGEVIEVSKSKLDDEEREIYNMGLNPADEEMRKMYEELGVFEESSDDVTTNQGPYSLIDLDEERDVNVDILRRKQTMVSHVSVPSQKDIESALVERKKRELLEQYMSDDFLAETTDTRAMLGMTEDQENEAVIESVQEN